jgi:apolipoprotein N-acyltransferase
VAAAFLVPKKKRGTLLIASLMAAAVLQAGRLVDAPAVPADRAALLVQENIPVDATWTRDNFQRTLRELADLSVKAASNSVADSKAGKVDLIVWPESPAPFFTSDPLFRDPVSQMAREAQSWVVTGAIGNTRAAVSGTSSSQVFNSAAVISPAGDWTARYDKVHLVPFGEYLPFPKLFAFAGGLTKEVGEFQTGASRAQVLVNLSNDGWYGDSGAYAQHLNQTRMRAIENDRWILSATDTGVTASIDPYGRVVARLERKERGALVAPYALTSVTTFYTRHGDWFAWLCAIISVAALLTRFGLHIRAGKKAEPSS